jgi:hypothetical protein
VLKTLNLDWLSTYHAIWICDQRQSAEAHIVIAPSSQVVLM